RSAVNEVAVLPDGTWVPVPSPSLPPPPYGSQPTLAPPGTVPDGVAQLDLAAPRVPASAACSPGADVVVPAATSGSVPDEPGLGGGSSGRDIPARAAGPTRRAPLGAVLGARSGDKGGTANLGVWARSDAAYQWLVHTLTTQALRTLLPEAAALDLRR